MTGQRAWVRLRDLQVGDLVQVMNADLTIGYREVGSIETARVGGATRYAVLLEGHDRPLWFNSGAWIEVCR